MHPASTAPAEAPDTPDARASQLAIARHHLESATHAIRERFASTLHGAEAREDFIGPFRMAWARCREGQPLDPKVPKVLRLLAAQSGLGPDAKLHLCGFTSAIEAAGQVEE